MENVPPSPVPAGDSTHDASAPPAPSPAPAEDVKGTGTESGQSTAAPTEQKQPPKSQVDDDDDESDFDELDDALDEFSKPKPSEKAPAPAPAPQPQAEPDFDEAAFMKMLEADMANMMQHAAKESDVPDNQAFQDTIDQGADDFTKKLEEAGIPPNDFLKQLLADVIAEGTDEDSVISGAGACADAVRKDMDNNGANSNTKTNASTSASGGGGQASLPESFNDRIQETMNRMRESGDKATAAAADPEEADIIAQVLKQLEGAPLGEDGNPDYTKLFETMMESLSTKEMLQDPIRELESNFWPWIEKNKGKVPEEDMARYVKQASVVSEIVTKFNEPGYVDEDPVNRKFVWDKIQEMQDAGDPPKDIMQNPAEELKSLGGDCPQQ